MMDTGPSSFMRSIPNNSDDYLEHVTDLNLYTSEMHRLSPEVRHAHCTSDRSGRKLCGADSLNCKMGVILKCNSFQNVFNSASIYSILFRYSYLHTKPVPLNACSNDEIFHYADGGCHGNSIPQLLYFRFDCKGK